MADVVVTVPRDFGLAEWIAEGDAAGQPWSGQYWSFYVSGGLPAVRLTGKEWCTEAFPPSNPDRLPNNSPGDELVWSNLPEDGGIWLLAEPDQRCYIVCAGCLRGYSPLFALEVWESRRRMKAFIRRGDAVAVTIPEEIRGFRGYRYRWWERASEVPFPNWKNHGAKPWESMRREARRAGVAVYEREKR